MTSSSVHSFPSYRIETNIKRESESEIFSRQSSQSQQTDLASIFSVLEENILTFVKNELKMFKRILSPELPEGFESQKQDKEMVDTEDEKQESSAREGALKITLQPRGCLLTNLIKGNLLPLALIWITTRLQQPTRSLQVCFDQVTEVRGFNDSQKEEYFRKRFSEEDLASRIISHIKTSRSLHLMCHIPVFCWISATVLEHMLNHKREEMPKTLTEMYTHLVVFHTKQKNEKYLGNEETGPHWNKESILSLGKLAFQQLVKGNLIFYEEDLKEAGIDVNEASVYSGLCTQLFKEECGLYQDKVYCFVHLSIQEFLAAVYVFLSFINNNENLMDKLHSTSFSVKKRRKRKVTVYKSALDETYKVRQDLDLFLRFLLGLSLESNQKHLQGLLTKSSSSQSHEETVMYIKKKIRENPLQRRASICSPV
ncbi:NLR family CARD domain-containing protein 3-like [Salvelinus sp. IW2-2015]|uniref:NLR family CARD domain-containing protein 3-like n=1 Tax=Salvelinus sp. IW2-2015 TaxID=2691554 RepID=UPI0038D4C357